jgi:hypothetical protein
VIKLWRRRWETCSTHTYTVLFGKYKGRRPLEVLRVDGRIILKWILKK